jgi:predicted ATPase
MQQTNWCVITGAPCSGKTSVINQLYEQGYRTAPEVARHYINRLLHHEELIPPNLLELQQDILHLKCQREEKLSPDKLIFFDRGIPDSLAYYQLKGFDISEVQTHCQQHRYKQVFLFERLPLKRDNVREEDEATARQLDSLIREAYLSVGYELILVPVMPIAERTQFVLSHLQHD